MILSAGRTESKKRELTLLEEERLCASVWRSKSFFAVSLRSKVNPRYASNVTTNEKMTKESLCRLVTRLFVGRVCLPVPSAVRRVLKVPTFRRHINHPQNSRKVAAWNHSRYDINGFSCRFRFRRLRRPREVLLHQRTLPALRKTPRSR